MTKAITDELGLPSLQEALKETAEQNAETQPTDLEVEKMANALQNLDPKDLVVEDVIGVNDHTAETDDIYEMAVKAHKDLLDLGFNIEPKHAGANAFTPAMKALEIALKASQSKAARKMERIKLMMEKEAHEKEMNQDVEDGEIIESGGQSIVANRNDLMAKIRKGEI